MPRVSNVGYYKVGSYVDPDVAMAMDEFRVKEDLPLAVAMEKQRENPVRYLSEHKRTPDTTHTYQVY